jgi:hypothetical protein
LPERRGARRFKIAWAVAVEGVDESGRRYNEASRLENISSTGALVKLSQPVNIGQPIEVWIRIPFRRENWMKYPAEIVRVEGGAHKPSIAVKFTARRPTFIIT